MWFGRVVVVRQAKVRQPDRRFFPHLVLELATRVLVQFGEFFERRQFLQRLQPEEFQKRWRRTVQHWPSGLVLLANDANQFPFEKTLQHRATIYATDIVRLWTCDRLAVCNDRQRLQLGARKLDRFLFEERSNVFCNLGVGTERVSVSNSVDTDPLVFVIRLQRIEDLLGSTPIQLERFGHILDR